jgi:hypothetical protein
MVCGGWAGAYKDGMNMHPWHDVALPDDLAVWFPVFVEIPKGSKVKY